MPTSSRFRRRFRRGSWQSHPCHRVVPGGIAGDVIPDLEIPRGTPLVYGLEADFKPIPNEFFDAAHGNSIHTIVRYLEDIAGDVILGLEIPRDTSLVYELDADLKPIPNEFSSRLMAIPSVPS